MSRVIISAAILAMFVFASLGCSQDTPVAAPTQQAVERSSDFDSHVLWGYYRFYIDPVTSTVEVLRVREAEKHWNVKPFLLPPNCSDCVKVKPTGPYENNQFPINVTIKNPEGVAGYDVRGILISNDEGVGLTNADNYTGLFDDGGDVTINPFKAFATEVDKRKFGPGESHSAPYGIYLESFGKVAKIDYAVDANWPGRAKEPYLIGMPMIEGLLDSYGLYEAKVTALVQAAGDDVNEVWLDLSSLGFTEPLPMTETVDDNWESSVFTNEYLSPEGEYRCIIKASTESSAQYLYAFFDVNVYLGSPIISLQDDVQPVFNQHCTACHQTVGPPLELDLSEGNAYANTVGVDSAQSDLKRVEPGECFMSYLMGKLMPDDIHLSDPFNGDGDRMPKNGPPYVPDDEQSIIWFWIEQGALDN